MDKPHRIHSNLNLPVTEDDIEILFKALLRRDVNNDRWKSTTAQRGHTVLDFISQLRGSEELRTKIVKESGIVVKNASCIDDYQFRLPQNLAQSPNSVKKILLIGSCMLNDWKTSLERDYPGLDINRVTFNNASTLPEMSTEEAKTYDFQLLQLPLRSVLGESAFFSIKANDEAANNRLFDRCCTILKINFDALIHYNREFGIESYILGFYTPIQNPMGRAQPRYKLNNLRYFIERLNQFLYELIEKEQNVYFIDLDEIVSTYGRKYFQDDFLTHTNHGSVAGDIRTRVDRARLEPTGLVDEVYAPNIGQFIRAAFEEAVAAHKTRRQVDSIKLVIFDLDDTLWRGVAAEMDDPGPELIEGWPLGIIEAASTLWRRGILIAIASKNDEANVRAIWEKVVRNKFSLDQFAAIKINWSAKADNVAAIIKELNLLPNSVLFVDDNPVERAAVKEKFPEIRVMDAPLVEWRRILLWAPELQRSAITEEAVERNAMIKAQIAREETRQSMGQEDFLKSLEIGITPAVVTSASDAKFERCFELLNKTNQFNTTGRRWSVAEINAFLDGGGFFVALTVADIYTDYGMTGLLLISDRTIVQFVLSCRVFGMGIEHAAVAIAAQLIDGPLEGLIVPTEKNKLSQVLFRDLAFTDRGEGHWIAPVTPLTIPGHITVPSTVLSALIATKAA